LRSFFPTLVGNGEQLLARPHRRRAHGYSHLGNYYMIPQDYQGGGNPVALKAHAIGQERIQEWLASRIKAKRAVILLDTCESGALTGQIRPRN
jgi:hypothetical protein